MRTAIRPGTGLLGGAVALLVAGQLAAQPRPRCAVLPCDSMSLHLRVRLPDRDMKLRLDSLLRELDEEPLGSPDGIRIEKQLLGVMTEMADAMPIRVFQGPGVLGGRAMLGAFAGRSIASIQPKGWIGISIDAVPHQEFFSDSGVVIRYFEHPAIISVDPDSPADRSGIARGDLLLSYNGDDVTGPINLTALLQPRQRVAVRVRRAGEVREFPVLVGKAPVGFVFHREEPTDGLRRVEFFEIPPNGVFQPNLLGASGVFGALLSTVDGESGRAYGVQSGLLVNAAPEGTPARESGLRGGDVIVRAGGEPVRSLPQFRAILRRHAAERQLSVDVSRERKVLPIVLTWSGK